MAALGSHVQRRAQRRSRGSAAAAAVRVTPGCEKRVRDFGTAAGCAEVQRRRARVCGSVGVCASAQKLRRDGDIVFV